MVVCHQWICPQEIQRELSRTPPENAGAICVGRYPSSFRPSMRTHRITGSWCSSDKSDTPWVNEDFRIKRISLGHYIPKRPCFLRFRVFFMQTGQSEKRFRKRWRGGVSYLRFIEFSPWPVRIFTGTSIQTPPPPHFLSQFLYETHPDIGGPVGTSVPLTRIRGNDGWFYFSGLRPSLLQEVHQCSVLRNCDRSESGEYQKREEGRSLGHLQQKRMDAVSRNPQEQYETRSLG